MNLPSVRFGHIGLIYGPKDKAQKLLEAVRLNDAIEKKHDGEQVINFNKGIYFAENWSEGAKIGLEPLYVYLTGEHLKDSENRSYGELFNKFHQEEYLESRPTASLIGEETASSACESGKGSARIHKVFNLVG